MNQELRLVRRITLKLIPFLILLYLIAYVDRSAVGFAKLHMGADIGIGDALVLHPAAVHEAVLVGRAKPLGGAQGGFLIRHD